MVNENLATFMNGTIIASPAHDVNTQLTNGFYYVNTQTLNNPGGIGIMLVMGIPNAVIAQLIVRDNSAILVRFYFNGSFSTWVTK